MGGNKAEQSVLMGSCLTFCNKNATTLPTFKMPFAAGHVVAREIRMQGEQREKEGREGGPRRKEQAFPQHKL